MFQIPWLSLIFSIVALATQLPWFHWFLWFFLSSIMTSTLMGLKLLLQASVSHHTYPAWPPPLPDPWSLVLLPAMWSLGFLWLVAPHLSPSWQTASLVIHLPSLWPFLWLPRQYTLTVLDNFSNMRGGPSWFVQPTHLMGRHITP